MRFPPALQIQHKNHQNPQKNLETLEPQQQLTQSLRRPAKQEIQPPNRHIRQLVIQTVSIAQQRKSDAAQWAGEYVKMLKPPVVRPETIHNDKSQSSK